MNDLSIIRNECEKFHGISHDQFMSKSRKKDIVNCRQQAMYIAQRNTKESLETIGYWMGGKDHATVLHAKKTVKNRIDTEKDYREELISLENRILMKLINRLSVIVKVSLTLNGETYKKDGKIITPGCKEVFETFDHESDALRFYRENELFVEKAMILITNKPKVEMVDEYTFANEMTEVELNK